MKLEEFNEILEDDNNFDDTRIISFPYESCHNEKVKKNSLRFANIDM